MLHIKQLTVEKKITCNQQKQVLGGSQLSFHRHSEDKKYWIKPSSSSESSTGLWSGYANGTYNIEASPSGSGTYFTKNGSKVGAISSIDDTVLVKNPNYSG